MLLASCGYHDFNKTDLEALGIARDYKDSIYLVFIDSATGIGDFETKVSNDTLFINVLTISNKPISTSTYIDSTIKYVNLQNYRTYLIDSIRGSYYNKVFKKLIKNV
ncbi:MAG: hypothetical protein E6772_04325 [Dysgonomonas sp.]|nr:hypothetical protein [Dysgonomonas sp.]